ncbi:murein L,D-transpeptidase catalytic domain family protein [Rhizorhabdus argentea]|uniref:murein L,D-transpeptidase catalytic domain family protein n=1 Tax=Rhizorhabdus argentea TaxID=1387174 RepID=UPI0030EF6CC6
MQDIIDTPVSRRGLLGSAIFGGLALAAAGTSVAAPLLPAAKLRPEVRARALAAMSRHVGQIKCRDLIGICDFDDPSSAPRFHLLDVASGKVDSLLVAHGRGSDPGHTGWLQKFSNAMGSAASSSGAFVTGEEYYGNHGRSRRIDGLDPTNSNARARAVVIHGAWYAEREMIAQHGKLGRSEGCFAFGEGDLAKVMARLGPGRLIYADKIDRA